LADGASIEEKKKAIHKDMQLAVNSAALIKSAPDALEEARKAQGLDVVREKITKWMINEISFEKGFDMLKARIIKEHGIRVDDMAQLAEHFPNITSQEIALFSLLEKVPNTYLNFGTKVEEGNKENRYVPLMYFASHDGLTFTIDRFDDSFDDAPMFSEDAYKSGGFTGVRENQEFVKFRPDVKDAFGKLILLCISNRRVYERMFDDNECVHIGQGNISRTAYKMIFGRDPLEKHESVNSAIESLKPSEREKFSKKLDELEKNLLHSRIFDITFERNLELSEIYKIIGLLDHMPVSFEKPFSGYLVPYSVGVQVLGQDKSLLESVPFHPFYAKELVNNIYHEQKDIKKDNKTVTKIFEALKLFASDKIGSNLSTVEKMKISILQKYGIDISILPETEVGEILDKRERIFLMMRATVRQNRKIGYDEMLHIKSIISKVPVHLLGNIKSITKDGDDVYSIKNIMDGRAEAGTYNIIDKEITLYERPESVYGCFNKLYKQIYSHVLAHEIGESIWASLSKEQKEEWTEISQWKKTTDENGYEMNGVEKAYRPQHFLTFYSRISSVNDDFSDHFAIYLLQGREFKEKAARYKPLGKKYAFLMKLFTIGDKVIEHLEASEFTIEQITGKFEREIQKQSIEEAVKQADEINAARPMKRQ
jgi:hypothetical protein